MTADKIVDALLCAPPSSQNNKFKFFTPSNVLGKERYWLKVDMSSEYQPTPPELASATESKAKVSQYTVSAQNLLHTEELMRRAPIYGSITDSLVASILKYIPEEAPDKVVQVRIMHKSSLKAIASDNLQLIHKDVVWGQLQHITRAITVPFHGHNLVGPGAEKFDEKIFTKGNQHALHRGLTSHFEIPKKPDVRSSNSVQAISLTEARTTGWPGGKQPVLLEGTAGQVPKQLLHHHMHHRRSPSQEPKQTSKKWYYSKTWVSDHLAWATTLPWATVFSCTDAILVHFTLSPATTWQTRPVAYLELVIYLLNATIMLLQNTKLRVKFTRDGRPYPHLTPHCRWPGRLLFIVGP